MSTRTDPEADSRLVLGCIADDLTGATDLGNALARGGMRVALRIGVPAAADAAGEVDAVVIALKSRTAPVVEAVAQARACALWLRKQGARQLYFKVCSTFDSTPQGNIGPVAQALCEAWPVPAGAVVPVTPAFPATGRTVYQGHLFVGDVLLSDSPMRDHPLTPMTDADLRRLLAPQVAPAPVGLVPLSVVAQGAAAIGARLAELGARGERYAVVDALDDAHLAALARAARDAPLVVAASGLAAGLARAHGFDAFADGAVLPPARGAAAIVAGSCSAATRGQVAQFIAAGGSAYAIDPLDPLAAAPDDLAQAALAWARPRLGEAPVLVYSTAAAESVRAVQDRLGVAAAGARVEAVLSQVARGLVEAGVKQLVVAGGETSGACLQTLGARQLAIGPQVAPGVPWCHAPDLDLHLCLKSGNFGDPRFFMRAFEQLAGRSAGAR